MTTRAAVPEALLSDAVRSALDSGRPVVALESTIFSNLGLPSPANAEALDRSLRAIVDNGATPAVTAVLDGRIRVGLEPDEHERILGAARKVSGRDLAPALAQRWEFGATTVAASLAIAASVGIRVFTTGGIGGVHADVAESDDVSADLTALARYPVLTVCAGAKTFLDHARTLERLETLGVPVIGFRTDSMPGFYVTSTGLPVQLRLDDPPDIAAVAAAHWSLGYGGLLVAAPTPDASAISDREMAKIRSQALEDAGVAGITGPASTPFVLARIADLTQGRSIPANLALAENNARIAATIAVAFTC